MAKVRRPVGLFNLLYRSKGLLAIMCAAGVGCVAYGMAFKNNPVFIVGIILVGAGYLIIRKHLKESLKPASQSHENN